MSGHRLGQIATVLHRVLRSQFAIVSMALALPSYAAAAPRPTFMSINACTDQLLIALADPEQIRGITRYARDPRQSPVAEQAARLPLVSGTAEEILIARPDIVLAGRFTKRATRDFVRERGIRLVEMDAARSLDEAKRQITEIGQLVGHPERARSAIDAIDAALVKASGARRSGTILPLQRRGWVSGQGTLIASLVEAIGLRNAGTGSGRGLGRIVGLEQVIALKSDYLLVSAAGGAEDQGSALLLHPALAALYPPEKRLVLPDRLVSCGGPALAEAIDALSAGAARLAP